MYLKFTLLAGSLLAISTMATARTEQVRYGDLDVTTAAGHAELQRRVKGAVWKVCRFDEAGMLLPSEQTTACQRATNKDVSVRIAQLVANQQLAAARQTGAETQLVLAKK